MKTKKRAVVWLVKMRRERIATASRVVYGVTAAEARKVANMLTVDEFHWVTTRDRVTVTRVKRYE